MGTLRQIVLLGKRFVRRIINTTDTQAGSKPEALERVQALSERAGDPFL